MQVFLLSTKVGPSKHDIGKIEMRQRNIARYH